MNSTFHRSETLEAATARAKAWLMTAKAEPGLSSFIPRLSKSWIDIDEMKQIVDRMPAIESARARRTRQLLAIIFGREPEIVSHVERRIQQGSVCVERRIQWRRLLLQLRDMRLLTFAELGGVAWHEFEDEARDARKFISDVFAKSESATPSAAIFDRLAAAAISDWSNAGESYFEAVSFAGWLAKRIRTKEPTSIVRLDRLSASLLTSRAVRHADAIGLPPLLSRRMRRIAARQAQALLDLLEVSGNADFAGKVLVPCDIDSDLDRWDLYRQVLAPSAPVSVIADHDMAPFLAEQFGIAVRQAWTATPAQAARTASREDLTRKIQPLPGEIVLVAVGAVSPSICGWVRASGGIGIDVARIASYWRRFSNRLHTRYWSGLELSTSLIEGKPFSGAYLGTEISPAEPCRSDVSRRVNLTGRFDALFPAPRRTGPRPAHLVLVVGHPRCGSKYVTHALNRIGLRIGHEDLQRDGICSWMQAVDDLTAPFSDNPYLVGPFKLVLSYVRDPREAIPSIMLENSFARSLDFRRFHIYRAFGIDIAHRRTAIERAIESYLLWMRLAERREPEFTLRVEHLSEEILAHREKFARAGFDVDMEHVDHIARVPTDMNASATKFRLVKPDLPTEAYRAIAPDLHDALGGFCDKYGYARPG